MKLNRNYWVWADTRTGYIWNDWCFNSKKDAEQNKFRINSLSKVKLKKIRIVSVSETAKNKDL